MDRQQFRAALKAADFGYFFADCEKSYKAGEASVAAVTAAAKGVAELELDLAIYSAYIDECYEKGSAAVAAPF